MPANLLAGKGKTMKKLQRYILREYLVPLIYCMVGFIAIYVLFELFGSFSRLMETKLPFLTIVKYFAGYLAPYFHYLAPAALMLAALYTMWNFCRHSELVAMRASGISFPTISMPIILVAVIMAGFVAWVNESYVPRNAQWAMRLKKERFDLKKANRSGRLDYRNSADRRIWSADGIEDPRGHHLVGVDVTEDRPDGSRSFHVSAERADWLDGEWWFKSPAVQHYDTRGAEIATKTPELDSLALRVFPTFSERPADLMAQSRKQQYNSVAGKFQHLRTNENLSDDTRREYEYAAWAQIMAPFACIIMTLFAIPAGVSSGRQSVFKGILGALGMFFAFYGLVIGGMVAANLGYLNPIVCATLPYLIFLVLGIRAFRLQR